MRPTGVARPTLPIAAQPQELPVPVRGPEHMRSAAGASHVMRTVARLVTSGRRRSPLFASCCYRRDWLFFASLQLEGGLDTAGPPDRPLRRQRHS